MATKNFRSTVLEPTSEFSHGDKLRFTALATVGEVLKGSFSETTIGEDGVYSIDLQYGKHRIDYKPYEGVWRHFADVEVNADTLATTLQDLALASVPVTDETILVLQGILADAESAKTESASMRDEAVASAAAAAAAAAEVDAAIEDSSFMKKYTFASAEDSLSAGTGNYTLVVLDTFSASSLIAEHPMYSIATYGADAVSQAVMIPIMSVQGAYHTENAALYRQSGAKNDIRIFYGKMSSRENLSLFIATRNTHHNNAGSLITVSTYKKLNPEPLGAVNIDAWLAENPSITETTKKYLGA